MKKLILLGIIGILVTGIAAAGGLTFQLGAGYHSSYVGEVPSDGEDIVKELKNMPLGIGGYVGLGWGFGEKKALGLGLEFAPSWDFMLQDPYISNFAYQGRLFLKWKPMKIFTLTGFFGYGGNTLNAKDFENVNNFNPLFGGRVTVLFLYAEYAAVFRPDWSQLAKHEIGIGFAFFR